MVSNYMPDVMVEIAFDSGYSTAEGDRTWTDVSSFVELKDGVSITYGRADEFGVTDANALSLTLDNSDGRFTADRVASPYYPNVKIGRPIRVTSTPVGGSPSVRFVGYVDEWPVAWDGTDNYARAQISARSRLARLGFDSLLPSTVTATFLAGAPYAYWMLNEPSGSTVAVDSMGGAPLTMAGTGAAVDFGGSDGPLNGGTSATFTASAMYLTAPITGVTDAGAGVLIEGFVSTTSTDAATSFTVGSDSQLGELTLDLTTGVPRATFDADAPYGDGTPGLVTGPATINDGAVHHVAVSVVWNGTTTKTLSLYVDGVLAGTDTVGATAASTFPVVRVGGGVTFSASHIALNADVATIADRAAAGLTGLAELAGDRIERYATYANIDPTEVNADPGNLVGDIDTTGSTAIDAMRKVEATETGVLFDARDNTLTFHDRAHRYNTATEFTLNVANHEVESDITPKLDRSTLTNDITATAADGTTAHAYNQNSIDDYGYARQTLEIAATNDDAYQAAAWRVGLYSEPRPRIPALGINLLPLSQTRQDDLFELDISSRITLSNQPTQAPATTSEYFLEGYTETISHETYSFVLNVSPTRGFDVFTLDDPVKGVLDNTTYRLAY